LINDGWTIAFYQNFFDDPFFVEIAEMYALRILVFNEKTSTITKWK